VICLADIGRNVLGPPAGTVDMFITLTTETSPSMRCGVGTHGPERRDIGGGLAHG
jgi:hypothetical protein